jgi:phage major head subunit gpT-like protein
MEQEDQTLDRAEIDRRSEIRGLCRGHGLDDAAIDRLIDAGATIEEAKAACLDHLATRSASRPVIRTATVQNDDPAVIVRRQADAVATRMSGAECPDDARQYLGESMLDLARSALERAGQSHRSMTADEVFHRAAHTTSDFALVVSNAMGKTAAQAYQAAESPLKTLCRQRVLRDFKTSTSIRLGGMGRLEELAENGEITHTSRAENGETVRLKTYARGLAVSRELLVNDDLGLLGDMTAEFGTAAAQTEADILVDLVTGNPALSDGTPVFDASRGNIGSPGVAIGSAGDDTAFDETRKFMRTVKGLDGQTIISATPRYLLVGPESETAAEKFLANIYATTTGDVNAWAGKLSLLVEPRITDDRWMVFADPARLPCLQYGYLASAQGVQIQRAEAWDTLGMKFRAWLDFGAGWLDWRGAFLNEGGA